MAPTAENRKRLFRFVCVPVRIAIATLFVLLLHYDDTNTSAIRTIIVTYLSITAFFFGVNFVRTFVGNKTVGGFGGYEWWHELRPVHIGIYVTTAVLIALKVKYAAAILYLDVVIGSVASIFLQD